MVQNLRIAALLGALLAAAAPAPAQRADSADAARTHYRQSRGALAASDPELGFAEALKTAAAWPRQGAYQRFLARVATTTGHPDAAFAALAATTAMGFDWIPADSTWTALRSDPRFGEIARRAAAAIAPLSASTLAATLPASFHHAEGIAYDSRTQRRFVASIRMRKVVVIDDVGLVRDFIASDAEPRLFATFGMAADAEARVLWVTTSAVPEQQGGVGADSGKSELRVYHLDSGTILGRWALPTTEPHCLGDVVLAPDGEVYATDSCQPHIYHATLNGQLTPLVAWHRDWRNLQGMAFSPDGCSAWVADWTTGLYKLDLGRNTVIPAAADPLLATLGIDGLYWAGPGRLIGIQNGIAPARVVELTLNARGDSVSALRVLDRNPLATEPTLGVVLNDALLYVGNSSWSNYNDEGAPEGAFEPQILLKLPVPGLRPVVRLRTAPKVPEGQCIRNERLHSWRSTMFVSTLSSAGGWTNGTFVSVAESGANPEATTAIRTQPSLPLRIDSSFRYRPAPSVTAASFSTPPDPQTRG